MGLARRGRGAMRRRCSFIADESRRRDRPQPPSALRVAAERLRLRCRSSLTMNEHCALVAPSVVSYFMFDTDLGQVHSPPCKGGVSPPCKGGVDAPLAKWIRSEKK